jgi:hypothetical protein
MIACVNHVRALPVRRCATGVTVGRWIPGGDGGRDQTRWVTPSWAGCGLRGAARAHAMLLKRRLPPVSCVRSRLLCAAEIAAGPPHVALPLCARPARGGGDAHGVALALTASGAPSAAATLSFKP